MKWSMKEISEVAYNFHPYDRNEAHLLPPSVNDWVSEDSLASFVADVVARLDEDGALAGFYARYREDGKGAAAYHPVVMVQLLLYAYCIGAHSSRRIAEIARRTIDGRYLTGDRQPDFRTVSLFRKESLHLLEPLFVRMLELCRESGLAKLGCAALDGTKMAANAALDANRTLESLRAEIRRELEAGIAKDEEEDRLFGPDRQGDELPEGLRLRKERMERLKEAERRLAEKAERKRAEQAELIKGREEEELESGKAKRGRKPKSPDDAVDGEAKANTTDPDSRIMKGRHGFLQAYNAQAMVDCESQVIVACDVTQEENDLKQLKPMLERCQGQAGAMPAKVLADAGYCTEGNMALESPALEIYVSTRKERKLRGATSGGVIDARFGDSPLDRMDRKLLSEPGRSIYKRRSQSVEPVFGQIRTRGLGSFLLRGLEGAKAEWTLFCSTHNLLKLWRSGYSTKTRPDPGSIIPKMAAAAPVSILQRLDAGLSLALGRVSRPLQEFSPADQTFLTELPI